MPALQTRSRSRYHRADHCAAIVAYHPEAEGMSLKTLARQCCSPNRRQRRLRALQALSLLFRAWRIGPHSRCRTRPTGCRAADRRERQPYPARRCAYRRSLPALRHRASAAPAQCGRNVCRAEASGTNCRNRQGKVEMAMRLKSLLNIVRKLADAGSCIHAKETSK